MSEVKLPSEVFMLHGPSKKRLYEKWGYASTLLSQWKGRTDVRMWRGEVTWYEVDPHQKPAPLPRKATVDQVALALVKLQDAIAE